jgi:hypothetical protein
VVKHEAGWRLYTRIHTMAHMPGKDSVIVGHNTIVWGWTQAVFDGHPVAGRSHMTWVCVDVPRFGGFCSREPGPLFLL